MTALAIPRRELWIPKFDFRRFLRPLKLDGQFAPMQRLQYEAGITDTPPLASAYTAVAVDFDGSADYLTRDAGMTSAADGKLVTVSFWINPNADSASTFMAGATSLAGAGNRWSITKSTTGLSWLFQTSGSVSTCQGATAGSAITAAGGWHHCIMSFDLANSASKHFYINDTTFASSISVNNNNNMDFTLSDHSVGASCAGTSFFAGQVADVFMWHAYIDLSVTANRRLFIDAGLKPVDPDAASGAVATLGTPMLRLTNPLASWHTNAGSGGGFTLHGALASATPP